MPAWRGWSESEVRQYPTSHLPAMAGFTPINAPASTASASNSTVSAREDGSSQVFAADGKSSQSVASEYLDRGDTEQPAPVANQALHGPGAKKASGKGRKRASTTNAAPKAKRRKSSDISEGLTVTKASVQGDSGRSPVKTVKKQANSKQVVSDTAKAPAVKRKRKHTQNDETTSSTSQPVHQSTRPVPVYGHATTMDFVHSNLQGTSVDAVKASSSRGATLYSSGHTGPRQQHEAGLAQPWLRTAAASSSAVSQRSNTAHRSNLPPVEEQGDVDLALDSLTELFDVAAAQQTQSVKFRARAQLPTPVTSDGPTQTANVRKQPSRKSKKVSAPPVQTDEDFIVTDDSDNEAMAGAAESADQVAPLRSPTPTPRDRKQNMRNVHSDEDYGGALLTAAERQILTELQINAQDAEKRIARLTFPPSILDRSPVVGATNATVLRTCFRIGEAMNVGCQALRTNKNVLLELYARVMNSWREDKPGRHQPFVFHDLYHDKAPHLAGTFDLWDQSRLWDLDSKAFLVPRQDGIMCRAIARMRRDGMKWKLEVLNIWEASWEDVDHIAGIYMKRSDESLYADD